MTSLVSQSAQRSDQASFVVETKNECRSIPLNAAQWLETLVRFDFRTRAMNVIGFDRAFFEDSPACDSQGIFYSLVDPNSQN